MRTKLFELTEAQAEELRNILTNEINEWELPDNKLYRDAMVSRLGEIKEALKWDKGQIIHE